MNTDRRRLLGLLAGVVAGGAGASAYARTSRADAGATFAASDVTVQTHDGALGAVTIAPAGTVSWSGLEESAGSVGLSLHAKLGSASQYHKLDSQRLDAAGLHGEAEYGFETRNLLDGPGFDGDDFEPDDGESLTREVRLRLGVTVYATDDETVLTAGYADAIFDVTVENRPENESVEGEANTGGEAENGENDEGEEKDEENDGEDGGENGENGDDGGENGGNGNDGGENGENGDDGEEKNGGEEKQDSENDEGEKDKNNNGKENKEDSKKDGKDSNSNQNNASSEIGSFGATVGE